MDQMMARWNLARLSRGVNVFQANGAVTAGNVLYALVIAFKPDGQAHVASFTMEEVISITYAANAASVAVILRFIIGIVI